MPSSVSTAPLKLSVSSRADTSVRPRRGLRAARQPFQSALCRRKTQHLPRRPPRAQHLERTRRSVLAGSWTRRRARLGADRSARVRHQGESFAHAGTARARRERARIPLGGDLSPRYRGKNQCEDGSRRSRVVMGMRVIENAAESEPANDDDAAALADAK